MSAIEGRRLRILLVAGTVALVALHLWIARDVTLPRRGPGDQWGYVGSARYLARDPHTYVMPFFPYFTYGYSIVLAPLVRIFDDPGDLFLAIKVLNATLAASVLPLLYLFGRCVLRARRPHALAGAVAGAVMPPLVAHPSSILAENLVLPLVIATVLACWLFLSDRPTWQRWLFAPAMVFLHVSHNRFAAALPLFFLLLLLAAGSRQVPARLAAANAGVAFGLLVVAQAVRNRIVEVRWVNGIETPQGPASDAIDVLKHRLLFQEYLLEAVGQAWYVVVGTLGLGALGVWAVVTLVLRDEEVDGIRVRERVRGVLQDPRRLTLAFLLGAAAAVFATSTYFFTRVINGSEGFVAGRHNDTFVPMWVAAGTVLVLAPVSIKRLRTQALGGAIVAAALTAVLLSGRAGGELGGLYSILNVPALIHYGRVGDQVVQHAATFGIGALLAVAVGAQLKLRPTALLPIACAWLIWSVGVEVKPDTRLDGWVMTEQVARLEVDRAAAIQTRFGGMPVYYPYFLPELTVVPWDGSGDPPEPLVFAELDADLAARGGRIAMLDEPVSSGLRPPYSVALWVLPGPVQDRLAADGALLPVGFPIALPSEARVAELEADGDGAVVSVDGGGVVEVRLHGQHAGTGSPWPDEGSAGVEGSVRVVAHPAVGATGPQPASTFAALPGWLRPGDPFDVALTLRAVDADGRALPAGRYEVAVGLEQLGFGAFSTPGAEPLVLVLEVR